MRSTSPFHDPGRLECRDLVGGVAEPSARCRYRRRHGVGRASASSRIVGEPRHDLLDANFAERWIVKLDEGRSCLNMRVGEKLLDVADRPGDHVDRRGSASITSSCVCAPDPVGDGAIALVHALHALRIRGERRVVGEVVALNGAE